MTNQTQPTLDERLTAFQTDLYTSGNWQGLQVATVNDVAYIVGVIKGDVPGKLPALSILATYK